MLFLKPFYWPLGQIYHLAFIHLNDFWMFFSLPLIIGFRGTNKTTLSFANTFSHNFSSKFSIKNAFGDNAAAAICLKGWNWLHQAFFAISHFFSPKRHPPFWASGHQRGCHHFPACLVAVFFNRRLKLLSVLKKKMSSTRWLSALPVSRKELLVVEEALTDSYILSKKWD